MAGLMVLSTLALTFFGLGFPVHAVGWVAVVAALCYLAAMTVRPRVSRLPSAPRAKARVRVVRPDLPAGH